MMQCNQDSRCRLLEKINQVSFAVNDILLYLDTHPCDEKAISYSQQMIKERKRLLTEYAKLFGPLTVDNTDESDGSTWKWMEQPFPWEKEGACR